MNKVLEVSGLRKSYPGFALKDLSFSLPENSIMGMIGRNGAGKTTTLKSILGLVRPEAGSVRCFGLDWTENEREIRQRIGFSGGAVDYYKRKKISEIVKITRSFYSTWDEEDYLHYQRIFGIDPGKTPAQLSDGMRVKLNLLLALSHRAKLLILDEPTSGLDPISRDEVTELFKFLRKEGVAILFSTHITSDIEKCADYITYIRDGALVSSEPLADFLVFHRQLRMGKTLEEIMIHYERGAFHESIREDRREDGPDGGEKPAGAPAEDGGGEPGGDSLRRAAPEANSGRDEKAPE